MSGAPFTDRLPPFQSCPPPPGQASAATDVTPPASVAVSSSHSCPPPRPGQDAAPGFDHTLPGAAFTITLSPAVALILRLVETTRPDLTRDEILARAIGVYATQLGLPALARDAQDLADLPEFERRAQNRFSKEGKLT